MHRAPPIFGSWKTNSCQTSSSMTKARFFVASRNVKSRLQPCHIHISCTTLRGQRPDKPKLLQQKEIVATKKSLGKPSPAKPRIRAQQTFAHLQVQTPPVLVDWLWSAPIPLIRCCSSRRRPAEAVERASDRSTALPQQRMAFGGPSCLCDCAHSARSNLPWEMSATLALSSQTRLAKCRHSRSHVPLQSKPFRFQSRCWLGWVCPRQGRRACATQGPWPARGRGSDRSITETRRSSGHVKVSNLLRLSSRFILALI